MSNTTGASAPSLHSLIPLADFKAILGIDDREDKISAFCLITATFTIEQYCLRRLVKKMSNEQLAMSNGDLSLSLCDAVRFTASLTRRNEGVLLPLREYPVREVLGVWRLGNREWGTGEELIEPDFYQVIADLEEGEGLPVDLPYSLALSPALLRGRGLRAVKVIYRAGYGCGEVPADLASACLELAAWNMSRYRGRRVGITGNVRGAGKDGEHLEASMPENVRLLLEPYRRRVL
jgi:hypothetical protein